MSDKPLTQHCAACLGHDFIGRQCRGIAARSADPGGLREALESIKRLSDGRADNWSQVVRAIHETAVAALAATPTEEPPPFADIAPCHDPDCAAHAVATPTEEGGQTEHRHRYDQPRRQHPEDHDCFHVVYRCACELDADRPADPGGLREAAQEVASGLEAWSEADPIHVAPRAQTYARALRTALAAPPTREQP
jgi:hypothetical protein